MAQPVPPPANVFGSLCEPIPENRFQYLTLNMNITFNAWKAESTNPLIRTAQEVARAALIPLLIVAAFEAIVKNGTFLIINLIVALANKFVHVFYPNAKPPVGEEPSEPVPPVAIDVPEAASQRTRPATTPAARPPGGAVNPAAPAAEIGAPDGEAGAPPIVGLGAPAAGAGPAVPPPGAADGAPPAGGADPVPLPVLPAGNGAEVQWRPLAAAGALIAGAILLGPGGAATLIAPAIPNRPAEMHV